MKDRFRFRAWDTEEDRYVSDDDICFDTGGSCDSVYDLLKQDDRFYIYEQCTGLKDKNGKLIYEGDILRSTDGFFCQKYKVKWDQEFSQFTLIGINTINTAFGIIAPDSLEIIGNIHENPELLEGNNG